MNSYSQGKSGGDMVFIEIAKRVKDYDKIIITSLLGKSLCKENGVCGKYLITTCETKFDNVIWIYIKRTIKAFFLKLEVKENDILLGTSDFLPDVLPIFWLKLKNKKARWIQHVFHLIPISRKIPFWSQKFSLFLIKHFVDCVVVDNGILKKDLSKTGFDNPKIFVNYPGINLEYMKTIKIENKSEYDGIFMAQLRPQKGIFDLVRIWKIVCQKRPKAKLGIIGKGQEEILKTLKKEIEIEGLSRNIDLLGYLEDDEAFAIIKASKVFVFPSREEGFGIAPLEAQALGLPVVAWDLPIFREIFKKGMIKIKLDEIKGFADEILELMNNESLYFGTKKEATDNSRQYTWDNTAKKEKKLLI